MYIYIDESEGDILVIAAVVTDKPKELKNVMRRTQQRKLQRKNPVHAEIKATDATDKFKGYFYKHLARLEEPRIYSIRIDKQRIPRHLRSEQGLLYLRMVIALLEQAVPKEARNVLVFYDRRPLKGVPPSAIVATLAQKFRVRFDQPVRFEAYPTDSTEDLGIQVADFVSHALFQKYQRGNTEWYDVIKKMISKEIDALKVL